MPCPPQLRPSAAAANLLAVADTDLSVNLVYLVQQQGREVRKGAEAILHRKLCCQLAGQNLPKA